MVMIGYLLPNDETEADRLDMIHEMMLAIMDRKLFLAPIKSPQRVIDLGTGTGIWAIDFGMLSILDHRIPTHDTALYSRSISLCRGMYNIPLYITYRTNSR